MSEKDLWEKDSELLYEKYRQAQDELERCAVLLQQKNEQLAAQALHVQQLLEDDRSAAESGVPGGQNAPPDP